MITSNDVINKLKGNKNQVLIILKEFNFKNITENDKEIRCSFDEFGNPNGVSIRINDLSTVYFSKNIHGFYNLLIEKSNLEFLMVHNILLELIGEVEESKPVKKLFGGFFENFDKQEEIVYYSEKELEQFRSISSERFLNDNVSISVQKLFDVRYDYRSNRIIIPWRLGYNELIGAVGRINIDIIDENIPKYMAVLPFRKSQFVFGLNITSKYISEMNSCYIFESEKSVMKAYQMGIKNCCAIGSHNMSENQALLLKNYCESTILVYDEGINEEEIKCQGMKLKRYFKKVSYVFDENNKFLPVESKLSPADLPINQLRECLLLRKEVD